MQWQETSTSIVIHKLDEGELLEIPKNTPMRVYTKSADGTTFLSNLNAPPQTGWSVLDAAKGPDGAPK